jgi:hypothetical protein
MIRFLVALFAVVAIQAPQAQVDSRATILRLERAQKEITRRQQREADESRRLMQIEQDRSARDLRLSQQRFQREVQLAELSARRAAQAVQKETELARSQGMREKQIAGAYAVREAQLIQREALAMSRKEGYQGRYDYPVSDSCQDIEVKLTALNALKQMDSTKILPTLQKLFARRDECSTPLRRRAMDYNLIPRDLSGETLDLVISIATTDPDVSVRSSAIQLLSNDSSDKAVQGLYKALTAFEDQRTQSAALNALTTNPTPSARKMLKTYIEAESTPEELKGQALQSLTSAYSYHWAYAQSRGRGDGIGYDRFGRPYAINEKADSAAREARMKETGQYLREVFPKLPSEALKRNVIGSVSSYGGVENAQWLLKVAMDAKEPIEIRRLAIQSVARIPAVRPKANDRNAFVGYPYGMPAGALAIGIDELVKAYDKFEDRQLKNTLVDILVNRTEEAAFEKLASIAKNDKDTQVRQTVIRHLSNSKDPRAAKALGDVINN